MTITDYQAKYIAYEITRRFPPDSTEKITAALVDAQVDLNPHQIDAALFAFKSPLSRGALLADEFFLPCRRLLGSSTFVIAGTLISIFNRLKAKLRKEEWPESLEEELEQDYEVLDETTAMNGPKMNPGKSRSRPWSPGATRSDGRYLTPRRMWIGSERR